MTQLAAMRRLVLATAAACLALGCRSPESDRSGEFVVLDRGDTITVERFREEGRVVHVDVAFSYGARDDATAWLGANGEVDSLLLAEQATNGREVTRAVFSDRAMITRGSAGGESNVPTSSRVMPFFPHSFALTQLLLRRAGLATGQTREVVLGELGRGSVRRYTLSRMGDTTLIADPRRLLWLVLDDRGNVVAGRTRDGFQIVRRPFHDAVHPVSTARPGWARSVRPDVREIGKCPLTDHPFSPVSVTVHDTLDGAPTHLRSDQRGPYVNDTDGVMAIVGGVLETQVPGNPWAKSERGTDRTVRIDLSDPVPGSGAVSRGIVGDPFVGLTVYHRKDSRTDSLFGPLDMAVGEEVAAGRVELVFSVGQAWERLWALSFGTLPRGYCESAPSVQDLNGTTPPILKRVSSTTWTVRLRRGSIGRLWSNIERVDTTVGTLQHGLYRSSGLFEFTLLSH